MRASFWFAALAVVCLTCAASAQAHGLRPGLRSAAPSSAALAGALAQNTGLAPSQVTAHDICPSVAPGYARCAGQALILRSSQALVRPHAHRHATLGRVKPGLVPGFAQPASSPALTAPSPGTPAYVQQAYDLTYLSQTRGAGDTIAVIDAFDDPTAESDLATYRSTYGLPACTTANGCFTKVNEFGHASPLPRADTSWAEEESLDLDAISALCPNCHILLIEAGSASAADLARAMQQAATMNANQISASWTVSSGTPISGTYTFPGIPVVAATGDTGYAGASSDIYPAAFPGVTAAGGTSLAAATGGNARGFSEGAWSLSGGTGGGSGCDLKVQKPTYQTDTGCAQTGSGQTFGRSYADVSADADSNTGLNIYDSGKGGWEVIGGTSLATSLISAYYAITRVTTSTAQWAYSDSAMLNDPTSGSTGSCAASIRYICNAGTGYDGPTGAGSISGAVVTGAPGIGGPANGSGSSPTYTQSTRSHGATLEGGIYANGVDTKWWIEYGLDSTYGQQTPATDIGAGTSPVQATGYLSHLNPGTTYHYRLVAQNSLGTTYGYDYSFATPQASPNGPTAAFSAPTVAIPGIVSFDARSSTGSITDYSWDFGDGTGLTDNGPTGKIQHPYANPGVYNVTLIVTDGNGLSDSTSQLVTVDAVPTPSFTAPTGITAPGSAASFDASGSSDAVGTITSYAWNFGDGTTGTGKTISHTYPARGTYHVTLTVTNDAGQTDVVEHDVTIDRAPTAAFTAPVGARATGSQVSFDGTASAAMTGGSIAAYGWDFGDGATATGAKPTHTYTTPGVYTVSLTVTDDLGVTATITHPITVDAVPVASFTAPTRIIAPGTAASFDASGSSDAVGTITSYAWNFGDGTTGTGKTISHTYPARGTYHVTLTVTNDAGQTDVVEHDVTIDRGPTAAFTAPAGAQAVGSQVSFDGTVSAAMTGGSIAAYGWDFGDGTTATGAKPTHTYTTPGVYSVSLTVTDDLGVAATITHPITVDAAPTASLSASPNPATTGPAVAFDGSGSRDTLGTITDYSWDFGDNGRGSGATASHAYATPGRYTVTLTVTNDAGQQSSTSRSITIDAPPTALFSVSPNVARTGATVGFNGGSSNDAFGAITGYSWNFGDGATAGGPSPSHTYVSPGMYTVALTVTNDAGQSSESSQTITVYAAPSARFSVAPAATIMGAPVSFNGSGSSDAGGAITGYSWNFGDGGTAGGPSPSHAYSRPGVYTVTLMVTGSLGLASSTSHSVTISPPPLSARLSSKRQKLATVLKHGLSVSVSTNTAAKASFFVTIQVRATRHGRHASKRTSHTTNATLLRTGAISFASGTHRAALRLSRSAANKLRTGGNSVLTLHMTLTDRYGRKLVRSVKLTVTH